MSEWDGKSKTGVWGYKIFVFIIKHLGINLSYFVLYFVAAYYFLFLTKSNRATFYYFNKRLGYPYFKAKKHVYKSYYVYGQTLIDKVAISAGMRDKFTYEFDGAENLKALLSQKKGGVLISAHIGNFEIAEYFLSDLEHGFNVNLVASDMEHRAIKEYLQSIASKSKVKFIIIKDDLSHVFEISNALSNNEFVCFTGDRYLDGVKYISAPFLGEVATFPAGPFSIASRLAIPVVFVYVMKETRRHYHLYARIAEVKHRDENSLLTTYVKSVEGMLQKYPLQWFNYYDFWGVFKNQKDRIK